MVTAEVPTPEKEAFFGVGNAGTCVARAGVLATPMLVILKINLALRRAIRTLDPAILNDDLRRVLDIEDRLSPPAGDVGFQALPLTRDPDLEELVRLYRDLPERQRQEGVLALRGAAEELVGEFVRQEPLGDQQPLVGAAASEAVVPVRLVGRRL